MELAEGGMFQADGALCAKSRGGKFLMCLKKSNMVKSTREEIAAHKSGKLPVAGHAIYQRPKSDWDWYCK